VTLQLSFTQFSPRLLRNFLRDRPSQVVLSAFVATFAYSAARLYPVGVSAGSRTASYPRLAVSGAIVLLFISLGLLVYFADHLVHSIQVDVIMEAVQCNTLAVIRDGLLAGGQEAPAVPGRAVPVMSRRSGYVQAVHPGTLLWHAAPARSLPTAVAQGRRERGGRDDAGVGLAPAPGGAASDPRDFTGFWTPGPGSGSSAPSRRTPRSGLAPRLRGCEALSPAVNDSYTAVQAVDHLSVIFCALARRPLEPHGARGGQGAVIVPARRFGDYLAVMCGLIRRCGAAVAETTPNGERLSKSRPGSSPPTPSEK
jgi:uncharacterized membrane protein